MQIANTNLDMASSHARMEHHAVKESLRMWVGQQRPDRQRLEQNPGSSAIVSLSDAGKSAQSADAIDKELNDAVDKDPKLNLLRHMMEAITGEKIRVFDFSEFEASVSATQSSSTQIAAQSGNTSAGYGLEYDYQSSYTETEQTSFSASGTIQTKDGQTFSFKLELSMSYTYHEETSVSLRLGDAARKTDPLVINFEGNAAQLQDMRFAFDLDADGQTEQINPLTRGSAFLVFDHNRDDQVNDGKELFGPTSGNGFTELGRLDDDKNGWIDENDQAFTDLKLWQPDANGQGVLQSLKEQGIGALAVAAVNTPFSVKNNENSLLGQIRATGLYLQEDGKPGTLQQIDLTT